MPTGTPTNRSNINLPTAISGEILQKVQDQSAVMQLARQIALPGRGLTIPVITSDPSADWVTETGAKPVADPVLSTKIMQAYKLAVIVPFSNEFRRDAENLYRALVARLPLALAQKFDETVFHGAAPGTNFDTFASVTAQSFGTDAYSALVAADTDVATHGGMLNGFVLSPQGRGALLAEKDGDQRPLFINNVSEGAIPMILGQKVVQAKAAYKAGTPNVLGIAGDWTQAMYGLVNGIDVSFSEEATLTSGNTTINLWQQNMFAVRAEVEVGFVADTDCFNKLTA